MRICIRRPVAGIVDGISLSHFVPGGVYEVSDSLGGYLITNGDAARAAVPSEPAGDDVPESVLLGGVSVTPPQDTAHDRPRTRRPARRRR